MIIIERIIIIIAKAYVIFLYFCQDFNCITYKIALTKSINIPWDVEITKTILFFVFSHTQIQSQ